MARIALIAMLLAIGTAAEAASWHITAGGGRAPDRSLSLIDTDSIRRDGTLLRFWTKSFYERPVDNVSSDATFYSVNCEENSYSIIQFTYWRPNGEGGTEAGAITHRYAVPGSVMAGMLDGACGRRDLGQPVVGDPEETVRAFWRAHPGE